MILLYGPSDIASGSVPGIIIGHYMCAENVVSRSLNKILGGGGITYLLSKRQIICDKLEFVTFFSGNLHNQTD